MNIKTEDPKSIALQFNNCINNRDLDGLAKLMSDDHTFIDREGKVSQSKQTMVDGWRNFFRAFPHYKNTFNHIVSKDNVVFIRGFAFWSEENPHDPVIWTATIVDDLVREWRVYVDTPENRERFNLT
ncbi:MAG: nuclear transport factor 2 family protein [Acidobacteriia bacterium]|nr:nuclear transport factor 2 family protein [Terriglobia bacterium]